MPAFPIYIYFLAASFLVSTLVFFTKRFPETHLKIFSPFLLMTLSVEVASNLIDLSGQANIHIYNYFTAFEFCFYLYAIRAMVSSTRARKVLLVSSVLYAIGSTIYITFFLTPLHFHASSYAFGCLLVVSAAVYYFYQLFKRPKSTNLLSSPDFWICTGLLFFYCSSFPLFCLVNFWNSVPKFIIMNFASIIYILNVFLYTLFSIAFLCRMKSRKYIS
jgi:uncharacterized membrane protein